MCTAALSHSMQTNKQASKQSQSARGLEVRPACAKQHYLIACKQASKQAESASTQLAVLEVRPAPSIVNARLRF
jgi:hypothetical protein